MLLKVSIFLQIDVIMLHGLKKLDVVAPNQYSPDEANSAGER